MKALAVPTDREKGWYLSLMAPNTKGPKFACLDPSRLYCNSQELALSDCLKDLLCPFQNEAIDLVAGIDAMGFILGKQPVNVSGKHTISTNLLPPFLAPVHTNPEHSDYSGREKMMEVRLDVLRPGLQVLIADQWRETGGTMKAAIKLVERQGATVVGIAAVAIENSEGGKCIKEKTSSHCIPEELQIQIDKQYPDSFQELRQLSAQTQGHQDSMLFLYGALSMKSLRSCIALEC
ncbi:adenine phosphoribosyltransferase [Coregonus clupeaformis]|uniref:adenine phosphoribosyltransferase n=1 Tax=Coregonus clupeaformis TaxID=59861 RepID=UPI001BDF80EF|nr:adenine phosphoribosyltransferase [Coregonus clupeaformis]